MIAADDFVTSSQGKYLSKKVNIITIIMFKFTNEENP